MATAGILEEAVPVFPNQQSVDKAGVLFPLPALLAQELLKYKEVYQELSKRVLWFAKYHPYNGFYVTCAVSKIGSN